MWGWPGHHSICKMTTQKNIRHIIFQCGNSVSCMQPCHYPYKSNESASFGKSDFTSASVSLHSWQIYKEVLGSCLRIVQRAQLTDKNVTVMYWWATTEPRLCEKDHTWVTSCLTLHSGAGAFDVMQFYVIQMWVKGVFGFSLQDWMRIIFT